jgi:ankyrin repeat protein
MLLTTSISALIDRGVDINMYNEDGETPLHVAMRCQVPSRVIMEMLRNGADVNREKKRSICDNENVSMEIDSEAQDDITHDVTGNDNGRSAFEYMLIYQQNIKLQVVREMLKYGRATGFPHLHYTY